MRKLFESYQFRLIDNSVTILEGTDEGLFCWFTVNFLHGTYYSIVKLENVAIANALQLEAARRRAVPIRFNFVVRAKFEVTHPVHCCLKGHTHRPVFWYQ